MTRTIYIDVMLISLERRFIECTDIVTMLCSSTSHPLGACLEWTRERCLYERAHDARTARETAAGWRARTQHRVPHIQHEQNHHVLDFCAFYLLHLFTWHRRTNKVTPWNAPCFFFQLFFARVYGLYIYTAVSLQANDC